MCMTTSEGMLYTKAHLSAFQVYGDDQGGDQLAIQVRRPHIAYPHDWPLRMSWVLAAWATWSPCCHQVWAGADDHQDVDDHSTCTIFRVSASHLLAPKRTRGRTHPDPASLS
jgi:hypothetical protein